MKKIIYTLFAFVAVLATSCSNDDIEIVTEEGKVENAVTLTVSLSNFYAGYDFRDTKHNIDQLEDKYSTFHSEYGNYIQVRTLFYNKRTGNLTDSLLTYVTTTNDVTASVDLPQGSYYAITTLTFADADSGDDASWWWLIEKNNIETVRMQVRNRYSLWSIMSVSSEEFTVTEDSHISLRTTPAPVGAIAYLYFQNFQYRNAATYGTIADNGIRKLTLYSQKIADEYKLNPNAVSKYNYWEDSGTSQWYFLSSQWEPTDFDASWTHFSSNLYDHCYILAPQFNLAFGYVLDGQNTFNSYGESYYTVEPGETYLAYWDYFQVGNPYFGKADNNHWNTYSQTSQASSLVPAQRAPLKAKWD